MSDRVKKALLDLKKTARQMRYEPKEPGEKTEAASEGAAAGAGNQLHGQEPDRFRFRNSDDEDVEELNR